MKLEELEKAIKELEAAKEPLEIAKNIRLYLKRAEGKTGIQIYALEEEGIYKLVGGVENPYVDLQATEGWTPPNEKPERKETNIYYSGRFIDALAAALKERLFYGSHSREEIGCEKHGYLVKVSLTANKIDGSLENIISELGGK